MLPGSDDTARQRGAPPPPAPRHGRAAAWRVPADRVEASAEEEPERVERPSGLDDELRLDHCQARPGRPPESGHPGGVVPRARALPVRTNGLVLPQSPRRGGSTIAEDQDRSGRHRRVRAGKLDLQVDDHAPRLTGCIHHDQPALDVSDEHRMVNGAPIDVHEPRQAAASEEDQRQDAAGVSRSALHAATSGTRHAASTRHDRVGETASRRAGYDARSCVVGAAACNETCLCWAGVVTRRFASEPSQGSTAPRRHDTPDNRTVRSRVRRATKLR